MGDLLSCPFCGGEAAMLCGGPGNWFVQCRGCKCSTNDVQHDHAVTLWNTRAEPLYDPRQAQGYPSKGEPAKDKR